MFNNLPANLNLPKDPATLIFGAVMIALFVYSIVWVYKDAKARGKNPYLVALLLALLEWPISIILWLVIRPKK